MKRQYSYDGGFSWHDYEPKEYIVGELINASSDCTVNVEYQWTDVPFNQNDPTTYECVEGALYGTQKLQIKLSEESDLIDSSPIQYRRGNLLSETSTLCNS